MDRREQGASLGNEAPQDCRTGFAGSADAVSASNYTTSAPLGIPQSRWPRLVTWLRCHACHAGYFVAYASAPQPCPACTTTDTPCPRCGAIDSPHIGPGNGPHAFRAECRHCGAFFHWVSKYTPAERQARRQQGRHQAMTHRPPSQKQLMYLQRLGDIGPEPSTMAEASLRIDALVRGEVAQ